jgi:predicted cupin superfamily sugar epimerase
MNDDAAALIVRLGLAAHPEGGYYRETYRSPADVETPRGVRSAFTSILFLLTGASFSAFHRIASAEAWHFYRGDPIAIEMLERDGSYRRIELCAAGPWQAVVPAGAAFASHCLGAYALVGCDVAPGFDFADFELCDRKALVGAYPAHATLIERLTREAAD